MPKVSVGSKVAYSVQFLRSIGMSHTDMAHARGIVVEIKPLGPQTMLAKITWDRDMPERVNVANLAVVGLNSSFSNVG
jgi:hypothetical protein